MRRDRLVRRYYPSDRFHQQGDELNLSSEERDRRRTQPCEQGSVYGRLTVEEVLPSRPRKNGKKRRWVRCRCACGKTKELPSDSLKRGNTSSCGCLARESSAQKLRNAITTHGLSKHPLFEKWSGMRKRCTSKCTNGYADYGGRGIRVCEEWEADFMSFFNWATANGWLPGLTIERRDNNLGYSPENCYFATRKVQTNNRRTTARLTAWGETKSVSDWLEDPRTRPGLDWETIYTRARRGWAHEDCLTRPHRNRGKELVAWGETKTVSQWLSDPRCLVNRTAVIDRLKHGWSPERAMSEPLGRRTSRGTVDRRELPFVAVGDVHDKALPVSWNSNGPAVADGELAA